MYRGVPFRMVPRGLRMLTEVYLMNCMYEYNSDICQGGQAGPANREFH